MDWFSIKRMPLFKKKRLEAQMGMTNITFHGGV
jgi:hypothetical protein